MKYKLIIERSAQKALAKIAQPYQDRIIKAIESLASEPRPPGVRKLTVRKGWRICIICIGAYRVIYEIFDDRLIVFVIVIRHRREAYR